jgi:hypothetical protein
MDGKRFEIPARYRTLPEVTLRYARWDLSQIDLVEPHGYRPLPDPPAG